MTNNTIPINRRGLIQPYLAEPEMKAYYYYAKPNPRLLSKRKSARLDLILVGGGCRM